MVERPTPKRAANSFSDGIGSPGLQTRSMTSCAIAFTTSRVDGQRPAITGSRSLFRTEGLRGPVEADARGDPDVQPVARKEDRAVSRDLPANGGLLAHQGAAQAVPEISGRKYQRSARLAAY